MLPELGLLALILALCLSVALSITPLWGAYRGNQALMASARTMTGVMFALVLLAFVILAYSFLTDDFSVAYVANHSNTLLPSYYKFSAVWGGHEGSLLLWGLMLTGWGFAVSQMSRQMPLDVVARVLAVMGMISVGFFAFMLFTSNPFARILPNVPTEGGDLNPLLQDPGLIFHPPILYMGYVGFSVAFAFAIAALLSGRLDSAWARWARPWTNAAWAFLTLGIALGSWWAYYELGWGGFWFWDPVENASLMPWLVGTALVHSLAVTEKRGVFKSWTLLLAILAFSLSLLGTFLVRSGVLTSVHAFANDPERGVFILGYLAVVLVGSLTLFALRAPKVRNAAHYGWLSREMFLLINNLLMMAILGLVLIGTLYPLIMAALDLGMVSVGAPFFNQYFFPFSALLCVAMGIGAVSTWKKTSAGKLVNWLRSPLIASLVAALLLPLLADEYEWLAVLALWLSLWVMFVSLTDVWRKSHSKTSRWQSFKRLSLSFKAMITAHIGLAFIGIGVCMSAIYSEQRGVRLLPGSDVILSGYTFMLETVQDVQGPNFRANEGIIAVTSGDALVATLKPQKRRYLSGGNIMTEAAIDSNLWRDVYVSLGEQLDGDAWAVRVHVKPFVSWIWIGALLMGLGGFMTVVDKRYRRRAVASGKASDKDSNLGTVTAESSS